MRKHLKTFWPLRMKGDHRMRVTFEVEAYCEVYDYTFSTASITTYGSTRFKTSCFTSAPFPVLFS